MGCPDQCILGQNLTFTVQAKDGTGAPANAASDPAYVIYEDEKKTEILSGTMPLLTAGNVGFYTEQIATTAANGFEQYKTYAIRITATVAGVAVAKTYSTICLGAEDFPASTSGALTTTANYKAFAGITTSDDDALIGNLISRATAAIESYCDRTLTSATYRERLNGDGTSELFVSEWPITAITMLSVGYTDVLRINNSSSDAYNAFVSVEDSTLSTPTMILTQMGGSGAGTDTIQLATGNAGGEHTITTLAAAIVALGGGWTAEVMLSGWGSWSGIELRPVQGLQCYGTTYATVQVPAEPETEFTYDADMALINTARKTPMGTRNITIRYTAGYSTTPADLEQICIDLVDVYYKRSQRDTSIKRERLDEHDIWYAGSEDGIEMPKDIAIRLAPYKKWRATI